MATDDGRVDWPAVERIYDEALRRDPPERAAFVADACGSNHALLREVQSLLAYEDAAAAFLLPDDLRAAASVLTPAATSLAGRRLGGYAIDALIGAGGMGDVYRARDLHLGRDVALKVLEPSIGADPRYRRRFEEEARSASGLNHPNIVTIHAVGDDDGIAFITMELVLGETLRQHIASGPMPLPAALAIGVQLTAALAAAHARGIVHRDLKPENVMVTPDGLVKVLDFGIAKRHDVTADTRSGPRAPVSTGTEHGAIVGTVGYMSPEQATGQPVGPASDQFSLGAILYEMLTGRRAFQRSTREETLDAIVHHEPVRVESLNPAVPDPLRQVIARCLAKDPQQRYASTRDLDVELRRIRDALGRGLTRRQWLSIAGGAVGLAAAGLGAWAVWPPHTVAVLPFADGAKDHAADYLRLGLCAGLIDRMKHLPIAVSGLSLVSNFMETSADARTIGRQIGVERVVTGVVTLAAGRVIIDAELIDVASGTTIWQARFDRLTVNIFTLWDQIASAIVDDGLHLRLTREERRALLSRPTDDAAAYELFLRARTYTMAATEDDYLAARLLMQQAVDKDARFAEAWIGLAGTYWLSVLDTYLPPADAWPQVHRCLAAATAVNAALPDLPFGRAIARFFGEFDWRGADAEWRAAWAAPDRDLQPELLLPYAFERWVAGAPLDAVRIVRRARAIDPLTPIFILHEASHLLHAGRLDEAAASCAAITAVHPTMATPFFVLADVHVARGRFDDAIAARRRAHALAGDADPELDDVLSEAAGAEGYARVAETAIRRLELPRLQRRKRVGYASPLDFARAYAQVRERDLALAYLAEALDERSPGLVFVNVDRAWDPIRDDPGFAQAAARVGVPAVARP